MSTDLDDARYSYDRPELAALWRDARAALESPTERTSITVDLPDTRTRHHVTALLGLRRPPAGARKRIDLAELDANLRRDRFGLSLEQVLKLLHGRPVTRREATADVVQRRREFADTTLRAALATYGLDQAGWAERWIDDVRRYGKIAPTELPRLARRAAAVLSRIGLPDGPHRDWIARGDLAARFGGGAHALDPGQPLSRMVLRAAAIAHDVPMPQRTADARELWERCRIALDSVSATVLCYALPCEGNDPWSEAFRARTGQRLPTHLTLRDLAAAPRRLVTTGTLVWVCENPRLVDAAIDADIRQPLVCVSGYFTTPARVLLTRLTADGADIRYHGDFDPDGLAITRHVLDVGHGRPWRMSAVDYHRGVQRAHDDDTELQPLTETTFHTPWDPALGEVMAEVGLALEEEVVLDELLQDLASVGGQLQEDGAPVDNGE